MWREFGLGLSLMIIFFLTWAAQLIAEWQVFTDEQRNEAVGEADERYQRFVGENLQLGDVLWGLFSMAALVRAAEFQQGSA